MTTMRFTLLNYMPNLAYHDVNRKVKTLTETQECVDLATNK